MIILNGGHEAFIQQLEKFGPSQLIKNLKNSKFLQVYGRVSVEENMFEFPQLIQFKNFHEGLETIVIDLVNKFPDPGY
jgi:hypothetical protein